VKVDHLPKAMVSRVSWYDVMVHAALNFDRDYKLTFSQDHKTVNFGNIFSCASATLCSSY
jgi:hypothetical protein